LPKVRFLYRHQRFFVQLRFKPCCLARLLSEEILQGVLGDVVKPSEEVRFVTKVRSPRKATQANLLAEVFCVVSAIHQAQQPVVNPLTARLATTPPIFVSHVPTLPKEITQQCWVKVCRGKARKSRD